MPDILQQVGIKASAKEAFSALAALDGLRAVFLLSLK
jgi:hypothetical protein